MRTRSSKTKKSTNKVPSFLRCRSLIYARSGNASAPELRHLREICARLRFYRARYRREKKLLLSVPDLQENECPCCLTKLEVGTGKAIVIPPCGHALHAACAIQMFTKSNLSSCPCCRASYDNILTTIGDYVIGSHFTHENRAPRIGPLLLKGES